MIVKKQFFSIFFWICYILLVLWAGSNLVKYAHYGLLFDFDPGAYWRYIRYPILTFFGLFFMGYKLGEYHQIEKQKKIEFQKHCNGYLG